MLPIPEGYKIEIIDKTWEKFDWSFGYCWWDERKLIHLYNFKFLPKFLNKIIQYFVLKHELGHAWGVVGCSKPWCLMFEGGHTKWLSKDSKWEVIVMPLQFLFGLRYCDSCNKIITKNMNGVSF